MGRLQSVPEVAPRALGMIRVSKERDGMISPDVQRAAILDYCRARGYVIADWVEGLDESGSRAKSAWWPRLDAAADRVAAGELDVVVVWKFSRAARHRLRWAVAIDKVEAAGGRLESATEQVDATTSTGRFTRGMLAELSAFEADRIGEVWKEVHGKRLAEGYAPNGKPRFGYRWDSAQKLHVPDETTGPVLAEAYRRYVAGESVHSLVRWLNGAQIRTTTGGMWADRSLRRVLDAGFGAGVILWRGEAHPGRHDRVIDEDLWQAYRDARAGRRQVPARVKSSTYLLSGLVRCGRCSGAMVANNPGDGVRAVSFRCRTAKEFGPERCAGGYVAMRLVEQRVWEWLQDVADDLEAAALRSREGLRRRVDAEAEAARVSKRLKIIEKAKVRAKRDYYEDLTSAADHLALMESYVEEVRELEQRVEGLRQKARASAVDRQAVAAQLVDEWEKRPVENRRATLATLLSRVEVVTSSERVRKGQSGGASSAVVNIVER